MKPPVPSEFAEQAAVIAFWAVYCRIKGLDERLLMASANGAVLAGDARLRAIRMARAKATGLRPGTPDLFLAVPRRDIYKDNELVLFAGLWLEMKKRDAAKAPPAQLEMADLLRRMGYSALICYGADEAIRAIKGYLES